MELSLKNKRNSVKVKKVLNIILIIVGAVMASFAVACVLLPNDAIDYGTAGIGIIASKLSGWNLSLCVFAVFSPCLLLGGLFLGRDFFLRCIVGSGVYMLGLEIFAHISIEINTEHFIAVAFGGAILGAGLALILKFGGCIDGSEILASIIVSRISEKKGKTINLTGILIAFNACVYIACFFLIDQSAALMSLLVYVVATAVLDHFTDNIETFKQVTIITKKPDRIIEWLRDDLRKTCTVIDSHGAIAGENKTVICYVTYFELEKIRENIGILEETAFVTVTNIEEIIR